MVTISTLVKRTPPEHAMLYLMCEGSDGVPGLWDGEEVGHNLG